MIGELDGSTVSGFHSWINFYVAERDGNLQFDHLKSSCEVPVSNWTSKNITYIAEFCHPETLKSSKNEQTQQTFSLGEGGGEGGDSEIQKRLTTSENIVWQQRWGQTQKLGRNLSLSTKYIPLIFLWYVASKNDLWQEKDILHFGTNFKLQNFSRADQCCFITRDMAWCQAQRG